MIEPSYKFCPQCAKPLHVELHGESNVQICELGHPLYKNQNVAVSAIIIRDEKLLLVRRARDPQKGKYDFAGGFVAADERPEQALIRELKEELSIETKIVRLLGLYGPDEYPYKGVIYYNTAATYQVEIEAGTVQAFDDVAAVEWIPLDNLPLGQMAFPSQNQCLQDIQTGTIKI